MSWSDLEKPYNLIDDLSESSYGNYAGCGVTSGLPKTKFTKKLFSEYCCMENLDTFQSNSSCLVCADTGKDFLQEKAYDGRRLDFFTPSMFILNKQSIENKDEISFIPLKAGYNFLSPILFEISLITSIYGRCNWWNSKITGKFLLYFYFFADNDASLIEYFYLRGFLQTLGSFGNIYFGMFDKTNDSDEVSTNFIVAANCGYSYRHLKLHHLGTLNPIGSSLRMLKQGYLFTNTRLINESAVINLNNTKLSLTGNAESYIKNRGFYCASTSTTTDFAPTKLANVDGYLQTPLSETVEIAKINHLQINYTSEDIEMFMPTIKGNAFFGCFARPYKIDRNMKGS